MTKPKDPRVERVRASVRRVAAQFRSSIPDCPYEIWIDERPIARCNYLTDFATAHDAAKAKARELNATVRLYFGGKSYDVDA